MSQQTYPLCISSLTHRIRLSNLHSLKHTLGPRSIYAATSCPSRGHTLWRTISFNNSESLEQGLLKYAYAS